MKPYGPRQNNPNDPLAMAMHFLESGLMTYAISVQICWQKYSEMCVWNPICNLSVVSSYKHLHDKYKVPIIL